MALLLHAIGDLHALQPDTHGNHSLIRVGDLTAVVSETDENKADASEAAMIEAALNHHKLLAGFVAHGTILPVKFGTILQSETGLRDHVARQAKRYRTALERLKGLREYGVRLSAISNPAKPETDAQCGGRAFLRARLSARQHRDTLGRRRRAFAHAVVQELRKHASDLSEAESPQQGRLVDIAALLSSDQVCDVVALGRQVADQASALGLTLALRGPQPPYSFAAKALDPEVPHVA